MKKILIAVDGSDDSDKGLSQGGELAKSTNSEVVLVTVQRNLEFYLPVFNYILKKIEPSDEKELHEKFKSLGRSLLDESKKALEKQGVSKIETVVKEGKSAEEILKTAEEVGANLIVVGCKGKHLSKTVLGSVSREVSERSKVSTLIAK